MAAKKKGPKSIVGTIRLGDKTYSAGQEAELEAAMKEAGIDKARGYGVDSTDRGTSAVQNDSERQRIAARQKQAEAEARGEGDEEDDEGDNEPKFPADKPKGK